MRGFLLITVLVLTLLIGGVMLSFFQQSIQQRFQSQAFLESQILFQELNGAVVQVQNYLLKFTPQQLQANPPVLNNSEFAVGFENCSGNVKSIRKRFADNPAGSKRYRRYRLRNADNSSGNKYLEEDGVFILEN